jgi:hypothetical protein
LGFVFSFKEYQKTLAPSKFDKVEDQLPLNPV